MLGDGAGRLYLFSADGYLLYEYTPSSAAAVTALGACPAGGSAASANKTMVVVGRADGSVEMLTVLHERTAESSSWRAQVAPAVHAVQPVLLSTAADRVAAAAVAAAAASSKAARSQQGGDEQQQDGYVDPGSAATITHVECSK